MADQKVIGCISSLSTTYSKDLFYMASLDYDGYPHIQKITHAHFTAFGPYNNQWVYLCVFPLF